MGRRAQITISGAFLLLLAGATAAPAAESRSPVRQRLEAGETVVRMAEKGAEGRAWRLLDAPPERVRRAVADLRHYAEFFPFVRLSQAWLDDEGRLLSRQVLDMPFPYPDRVVTTQVETAVNGPLWTLRWESLADSEQQQRAVWTVRPFPGGRSLVSLHLVTDADGIPMRLERRALESTLPWILDGLSQQVGRCRYDQPIHESCTESPPFPSLVVLAPPAPGKGPAAPPAGTAAPGTAADPPAEDPPRRQP